MQVLGCATYSASMALPCFNGQKELGAVPQSTAVPRTGGLEVGLLEGSRGVGAAVALGGQGSRAHVSKATERCCSAARLWV